MVRFVYHTALAGRACMREAELHTLPCFIANSAAYNYQGTHMHTDRQTHTHSTTLIKRFLGGRGV